jgi:hypothetical protein
MVLAVAICDLTSADWSTRREARAWVDSRNVAPASFEWICQLLDCDPEEVRERLAADAERLHHISEDIAYGQIMRRDAQ